jgi:hypothetical protein
MSNGILQYSREPTPSEIKFGHGARHYKVFSRNIWEKPDGRAKQWLKCPEDGLRYYR